MKKKNILTSNNFQVQCEFENINDNLGYKNILFGEIKFNYYPNI